MSFAANATVGRMPYETETDAGQQAAAQAQAQAQAGALPTWAPPIMPELQPRIATQADIDELLAIRRKYRRLVRAIKDSDAL